MARTKRYTERQVIKAIESGDTALGAGRLLGCSAQTIRNYAAEYPAVNQALKAKRCELVDLAEMSIRKAIVAGEGWAVMGTLRGIGREYGWGDQVAVTGADGGPIEYQEVTARIASRVALLAARARAADDTSGTSSDAR